MQQRETSTVAEQGMQQGTAVASSEAKEPEVHIDLDKLVADFAANSPIGQEVQALTAEVDEVNALLAATERFDVEPVALYEVPGNEDIPGWPDDTNAGQAVVRQDQKTGLVDRLAKVGSNFSNALDETTVVNYEGMNGDWIHDALTVPYNLAFALPLNAGNMALNALPIGLSTLTGNSVERSSEEIFAAITSTPVPYDDLLYWGIGGGVAKARGALGRFDEFIVPNSVDNFVGPTFGRSGYKSVNDFADDVTTRYQSFTDSAYQQVLKAEADGILRLPTGSRRNTVLGQHVDRVARADMDMWLKSEGISEGAGEMIQLNRWLRDPSGSNRYRIPDVYIPGAGNNGLILDGTIGWKHSGTPQIKAFDSYSNGADILIIRPSRLDQGGSYGILKN